jgi:hypothetical protein
MIAEEGLCQKCRVARPYLTWVRDGEEARLCGDCYRCLTESPEYLKSVAELYRRRSPLASVLRAQVPPVRRM